MAHHTTHHTAPHRSHRERSEPGRTVRAHASMETEQTAAYLEALAQALRAGGVTIRSGAGLVALRLGKRVELELEAGEEGPQSVVRLALRWETPTPEERLEIFPGVEQPAGAAPGPDAQADAKAGSPSSPRGGGEPSPAPGDRSARKP